MHRGIIYVIEGDIVLLSQAELKDLGVIPQSFPMIGEFGGVKQIGNGHDNLQVDSNLIAAENTEVAESPDIPATDVEVAEE